MVKEFAFINIFRAFAAFWVLTAHCMIWGDWYGIPLPSAKIAVDLFMMISGYLMAANAFARHNFEPLTCWKNWFRFWLRRYFRLAPAYYLSLGIAIVLGGIFLSGYHELQNLNPSKWPSGGVYDPSRIEYTLKNIILHISFLFGLHPRYSFSTFLPDWSLSLEMQFYFVFPFLYYLMHKFGFLRISILIGIPVFITGLIISSSIHYYEPSLIFFKLNFFVAGILLFRILSSDVAKFKRISMILFALVLVSIDLSYGNQFIVSPILFLLMLCLGWLELNDSTPKWISYIVNSRLTKFASNTSYGVYLFHGFFISAFGLILLNNTQLLSLIPYQRVLIMFIFVTISAYLTSYISYKLIELPGISIGKKIIQKIAPAKAVK
jgi:peptidoglycan/LPS O-acetylase OafA/YrhL